MTKELQDPSKPDHGVQLVAADYFKNAAALWKSYYEEFLDVALYQRHAKLGELMSLEQTDDVVAQMEQILANSSESLEALQSILDITEYMVKLKPALEELKKSLLKIKE